MICKSKEPLHILRKTTRQSSEGREAETSKQKVAHDKKDEEMKVYADRGRENSK